MPNDPYVYPGTEVLKNKLGLRDRQKAADAETEFPIRRVAQLNEKPLKGGFDSLHLQAIHHFLFQDLYDWAGHFRTLDISKGNAFFARSQFIQPALDDLFRKLAKGDHLAGLDKNTTLQRLAYYLGELNAIHPFREGNGRTQRELIRELALHTGYTIRWASITREAMTTASIESFQTGKPDAFYRILNEITRPSTAIEIAVQHRNSAFRTK